MAPATEKSQLDMILEMKDFKTKMDTVNTLFQTSINNATKLGQVVDAIATKVDNLAAVAANANSTVNKTFNNANTYTTNQNITRVTAGGKNKQTMKINDQVVSVDKTDQSALAKNARAEAIEALKKQNDLLDQQIEKAKKLVDVEQKRAELIGEKAKNYSRDSESKSKNAEANLLNAQTRSKYPWLFGSGANNRSFKYQGGKMLQNLGGVASGFGTGGKLVGYGLDTAGALLKSPAMGASAALSNLGKAISDLGKEAVKSFSEIESIKTQLGVVFSSQTQANSMFGEISQYAVKSPFGVQQTSELAILLKQSGVYATDLMDTLKMLGDTAGGNMEKMKRIANNYAQIMAIGKASMLDMRQFAYAGIPIFEAVSKELGVSQQELRKLISDGKVTADIIEKVFKDLTGVNGIFENATEKGAKTLKARLQNLADAKQLAFASIGEWGVNLGGKTGNDSYANQIVKKLENIYQWLDKNVEKKNTETKESQIEELENRINATKQLIASSKDDKERALFEKRLAALEAEYDDEKAMANYVTAYDLKAKDHNEYLKSQGLDFYASETAQIALDKFLKQYGELVDLSQILEGGKFAADQEDKSRLRAFENQYIKETPYATKDTADEYLRSIYAEYKTLTTILDNAKSAELVNGRESNAAIKRDVENEQTELASKISKMNESSSSIANTFAEIRQLQKEQESYQEKEKQLQEERVNEGVKLLNELKGVTDASGNLKFRDVSFDDYFKYIESGAFAVEGKFNVIDKNKDAKKQEDEKYDLRDNFIKALSETKMQLDFRKSDPNIYFGNTKGLEALESLETLLNQQDFQAQYLDVSNTKDFYDRITNALNLLDKNISKILSNVDTEEEKAFYNRIKDYIGGSTLRLATDLTGYDYVPEEKAKKSGTAQEFIPLWKRILAQYTGLTTTEMTSTADTMDKYRNDMAVRNMTANVMSATMKSMGVDTAMRLVSAGGAKQLKEDSAATLQVNWKQTKDNIKQFSLALSASTDVVSAYKKSLEEELDTYQQLIIAGYTQGEDQNGGESQFISVKKLAQYAQSNEQLVNAFGDTLETISGKKYNVDDLRFTQEGIFDKFGNKIEDQVKVTSNLSRFIENILPKMYEDLHEANVAELNNSYLANMYKDVASTQLVDSLLKSRGVDATTSFLATNPDYILSDLDSVIKQLQNAEGFLKTYPYLDGKTHEDIISYGFNTERFNELQNKKDELELNGKKLSGNETTEYWTLKNAIKFINEVFKIIEGDAEALVNTPTFEELKTLVNNKGRISAANTELLSLIAMSNNLNAGNQAFNSEGNIITSATTLKPEDYLGARGIRNSMLKYAFGLNQEYDIEDLYLQAAKTKNEKGKGVNQYGIDAKSFEGMSDEDILKNLNDQEKAWIRIAKAQEDSMKILHEYGNAMTEVVADFGKGSFVKPFEKMAENLVIGKEATDGMEDVYKNLTAELLTASGAAMQKAGWELVARGAADDNYAMMAAGLGLAATGGVASGLGAGLTAKSDKDKKKDSELEKLNKLRNNLADLLKQAREDAIYYENNLRHQKAISANDSFTRSVHDAIISPGGDIITTDPKDYLIATKKPQTLIGGGAPTINFSVIDKSTGVRVTKQSSTYNAETNSIDFEAVIESKIVEVIASSKGDDAFAARDARLRGRTVIA